MDKYFSPYIQGAPFKTFSEVHIAALLAAAALNILIIIYRRNLEDETVRRRLALWTAALLVLQELSFQVWNIAAGTWSVDYVLPLQLCSISVILSAVMLTSESYFLYEIVYFWGLGGTVQALVTPDLAYNFPHFRFFEFFLSHTLIISACFIMTFIYGFRPRLKSVWKAFISLNIYAAFMVFVNKLTGGNYLFLSAKPETPSLLDFLGPWPYYILSLEVLALVIFFLMYLPFVINNYISRRKNIIRIENNLNRGI